MHPPAGAGRDTTGHRCPLPGPGRGTRVPSRPPSARTAPARRKEDTPTRGDVTPTVRRNRLVLLAAPVAADVLGLLSDVSTARLGVGHVLGVVAVGGWLSLDEHSGGQGAPGVDGLDTRKHAAHHRALGTAYAEGVGSPGLSDRVAGTSWAGGAGGAAATPHRTRGRGRRRRQAAPPGRPPRGPPRPGARRGPPAVRHGECPTARQWFCCRQCLRKCKARELRLTSWRRGVPVPGTS